MIEFYRLGVDCDVVLVVVYCSFIGCGVFGCGFGFDFSVECCVIDGCVAAAFVVRRGDVGVGRRAFFV